MTSQGRYMVLVIHYTVYIYIIISEEQSLLLEATATHKLKDNILSSSDSFCSIGNLASQKTCRKR